jgi:hypothetical protein
MSEQEDDDDQTKQRFHRLVRRLLTMPPQSRAEVAEAARRTKREKANRTRGKRASTRKA